MAGYLSRRLLMIVPVLLGVSWLIFTMLYLTPGDPARLILGEQASVESIRALRSEMGLDDPYLMQFLRYLKNVLHGDLGRSYMTRQPVSQALLRAFPQTLRLALASMGLALTVGIAFGLLAALHRRKLLDYLLTFLAVLGVSVPVFWLGILLILLFTVYLGWLPPYGGRGLLSMLMPVVGLAASSTASIMRMTRSSMLEVVRQDFIRTARAKGLDERTTLLKHALPNALIPVLTIAGASFAGLLGGAVLTETIFSIPGIGRLMVQAISARDYPLVQGGVLLIAVGFSLINLLVDFLYAWLNPRIRDQYRSGS